jgi:hypothetical protein
MVNSNNTMQTMQRMTTTTASILPHQRRVLNYMFRVAPKQPGLLLAHYMGTGKTITALAYLQNVPQEVNVVIAHPRGLRHIWRDDARKLGINSERYTYMTHKELFDYIKNQDSDQLFDGAVVVIDEAHIVARHMDAVTAQESIHLYNNLCSARKILMMTGTPIYESEKDFRWLVNIAAGKAVLPIPEQEYRRLFYRKKIALGMIYKWAIPIMNQILPMMAQGESGLFTAKVFYYAFKGKYRELESLTNGPVGQVNEFITQIMMKPVVPIVKLLVTDVPENAITAMMLPGMRMNAPSVLIMFSSIISWLLKFVEPAEYEYLDIQKVLATSGKYVSVYEAPSAIDDPDAPFPSVSIHQMPCEYTGPQMGTWMMLTWKNASSQDLAQIIPKSDIGKAPFTKHVTNLITGKYTDKLEDWRNYGRVIGNMTFPSAPVPIKFKRILEKMADVDYSRIVVYSNFWEEGCLPFSNFLKTNDIQHRLISPDTSPDTISSILTGFQSGKVRVIILHPEMTEGLSILGARQLHILEPLLSYAKQQQLVARVVRFQSHHRLPVHKRHVDVFIWYASVENLLQHFKRHAVGIKQWFSKQAHVNYFARTFQFVQDLTPDALAMQNLEKLQELVDGLKSHKMSKFGADSHVPTSDDSSQMTQCCLWEPDASAVERCLKKRSNNMCTL